MLSENRTFEEALAVAVADETAEKEVKQFHCSQPGVSGSVDFTANTKNKNNARVLGYKEWMDKAIVPFSKGKHCYRCGSSERLADVCRHACTTCGYCRQKGHLAKVC